MCSPLYSHVESVQQISSATMIKLKIWGGPKIFGDISYVLYPFPRFSYSYQREMLRGLYHIGDLHELSDTS